MSLPIAFRDTNDWTEITCGNICNGSPAFSEWLKGKRYYYAPLMDSSDYGLNYLYRFENPDDALEMKLKFDCTLNA